MSILTSPPSWAKDAVPSPQGWRHARTNELLVSIKLDMTQFEVKEVPEVKETTEVKEDRPQPKKEKAPKK